MSEENQTAAMLLEQRVAALETDLKQIRNQSGAALGLAIAAFAIALVALLSS